ncbi:MAG: AsmA family protein [Gammaproteobacteria bacterium]|nr:AsmA family protein [Gammaproteobacteria bacterium]
MLKKIIYFLVAASVLLLTAIVLLPRFIDLDFYHAQITKEVQLATGRTITFDDELDFNLSLQPSLTLNGIRFANATWSSDPHMVSIDKLQIQLELLPLLHGDIHIHQIVMSDVKLILETDAKGNNNWEFQTKATTETDTKQPLPRFDQIELTNLILIKRNAVTGKTDQVQLQQLTAHQAAPDAPILITTSGRFDNQPLTLTTEIIFPDSTPNSLKLDSFRAQLGESDFSGNATLHWGGQRPVINATINSTQLALLPAATAKKPKIKKSKVKNASRLFSRKPLPFDLLATIDGTIDYQAKTIAGIQPNLSSLTTKIKLKQGDLTIKPLQFKSANATVNASIHINANLPTPKIRTTTEAKGINIGKLLGSSPSSTTTYNGKGELRATLQGRGKSVAAIMGTLNGKIRFLAGKGRLEVGATIDTITGGLHHVLGTIISSDASGSDVNCLASNFEIKNGIANSKAFLIDSEYATLFGEGKINLKTEKIQFQLKPKPKSVTLNVAVPVEVSGTLSQPSFTPEKFGTARKAAGIIGLFAYPPAALLGLAELGTGEQNPCLKITNNKGQSAGHKTNSVEKGTKAIKKTMGGIGGTIKGLFGNQ